MKEKYLHYGLLLFFLFDERWLDIMIKKDLFLLQNDLDPYWDGNYEQTVDQPSIRNWRDSDWGSVWSAYTCSGRWWNPTVLFLPIQCAIKNV